MNMKKTDLSKIEYFVGIDLGHGETSVSRVPGYSGEIVSQIPLRRTASKTEEKKVYSATCKKKADGVLNLKDYRGLVLSTEDFCEDDLREGFKRKLENETDLCKKSQQYRDKYNKDKESMRDFAKFIFQSILKNDDRLKYDDKTGERNFMLFIACPSNWRKEDENAPTRYLNFFRTEAGLPADNCINESDAAFYTMYNSPDLKSGNNDVVFVIDLGSSTVDFTTYQGGKRLAREFCWGDNIGAHYIEEMLVARGMGYDDSNTINNKVLENQKRIRKIEELRKEAGRPTDMLAVLNLFARQAKENYFLNSSAKMLRIRLEMHELVPDCEDDFEEVFNLILKREEFEGKKTKTSKGTYNYEGGLLKDYIDTVSQTFYGAAERLSKADMSPRWVILSGGASRMPFVEEKAREAFPHAEIHRDVVPEWIVSNGAALYAQTRFKALVKSNEVEKNFRDWAESHMLDAIKEAAESAFQDSLRDRLQDQLHATYVQQSSHTSLNDLEPIVRSILNSVTDKYNFINGANTKFTQTIDGQLAKQLENIIATVYKRQVTIRDHFIDPGTMFHGVVVKTDYLHTNIESYATELFCTFSSSPNWEKERSNTEREQIYKLIVNKLPKGYKYNCSSDISAYVEQVCEKIGTILERNGLFELAQ